MARASQAIGNDVYVANVRDSGDGSQLGSWNAGTGASHPAGSGLDVLYRPAVNRTDTNFSSLRVFRSAVPTDYTFGGLAGAASLDPFLISEGPSPLVAPGRGWRTVWRIEAEGLQIVQDVLVVGSDLQDSAIYHTVAIENFSSTPVRVGWRNLYDWSIGDAANGFNDAPTNGLESACGVSLGGQTQDEFSERPVSAGWVRVAPTSEVADYDTLLSLGFDPGLRSDLPVTVPDEYAYVRWGSARSTSFDYAVLPALGVGDSAGLSWFGRNLGFARHLARDETVRFTQALFAFPASGCLEVKPCAKAPRSLVAWWPFDEPDQGLGGRFDDQARDHEGTSRFAPTSIDGKVGQAVRFDGDLDQVVVQDADDLDLPAGVDLTIDFWIRTEDSSGVSIVLEKRTSSPNLVGYQVFLYNGDVGLQFADGGGSAFCSSNPATSACTNWLSQAFVADGEWHLVAVTVDRDDPQGGTWYLDGNVIGPRFNPTVRSGSLANDAPLFVGQGDPDAPSAGSPFAGDLDELEIARRELAGSEILDIFEAAASGKCRFVVDAPWDQPLCEDRTSVTAQISVCNEGNATGRFVFAFEGLPAMPAGVPYGYLCQTSGPTQFTYLGNQPLVVPPGECRAARVRISNPASQVSGQASCYQVTATNLVSGQAGVDFGFIPRTNEVCCTPRWPVTAVPVRFDGATPLLFDFEDTGLGSATLDVQVQAFQGDETLPALRLGGAAAGQAISRQITFGPDGRATLEVPVELSDDFAPLTTYEVVVSSDLDGDAEPDLLASGAVLPTSDPCTEGLNQLCLNQDRFQVQARWRTAQGSEGVAQAVPLTTDTGFLWFFGDSNLELVVKVLDACSFADRFWVFAGGLTNVEVELTVTDLLTGTSKSYSNPLNTPFQPIQDTDGFATCDAAGGAGSATAPSGDRLAAGGRAPGLNAEGSSLRVQTVELGAPVSELPLNDERFLVEVEWATPQGGSGAGQGVPITSDTGYFWFFRDSNVELVVKVLDACGFADRFWVFAGGLTNVEVRLKVTDTVAGVSKTYSNAQGTPFQPIQDTGAFATCP